MLRRIRHKDLRIGQFSILRAILDKLGNQMLFTALQQSARYSLT